MITSIEQNETMDAFNKLIPQLKILLEDDTIFGINNTEYCLKLVNDTNIPMKGKTGDKLSPGSGSYRAIHEKKVINAVVPKEIYGVPIKTIAIPIADDYGKIVGNIAIAKSLKKQEEIFELSKSLSEALNQITSAISNISAGIQESGKSSESILYNMNHANDRTRDTDSVLEFIRNIASQTNLLGLNAAIEASRSGDAGRGFSVVAQEIRKLSSSSSQSIKKIENVIKDIQKSVSTVTGDIDKVNENFQEQAAALEEITAAINEINQTAKVLENIAVKF